MSCAGSGEPAGSGERANNPGLVIQRALKGLYRAPVKEYMVLKGFGV